MEPVAMQQLFNLTVCPAHRKNLQWNLLMKRAFFPTLIMLLNIASVSRIFLFNQSYLRVI